MGGRPFDRGAIYHLHRNPTYIGMIPHKKAAHPGHHAPIVGRDVFDRVQVDLKARTRRTTCAQQDATALLRGRIFDTDSVPMTPTTAQGKSGQVFRYYVSSSLKRGKTPTRSPDAVRRVPARALEAEVRKIADQLSLAVDERLSSIVRVEIHARALHIAFKPSALAEGRRAQDLIFSGVVERIDPGQSWIAENDLWWLRVDRRMQFRGGRTHISAGAIERSRFDPVLARALARAHTLVNQYSDAEGRLSSAPPGAHDRMLIRLAFLAPDLQTAILSGRQPSALSLESLRQRSLAMSSDDQRVALAG